MSNLQSWVHQILRASSVATEAVHRIIADDGAALDAICQAPQATEILSTDVNGMLQMSAASSKRRTMVANSLPRLTDANQFEPALVWIKKLTLTRYRPLRTVSTLAALHLVELLLKRIALEDVSSAESKQILTFCGKISTHVCLVRCRDTFPVIRQIVAEYIGRWCLVKPEVFTSSVFGRNGALCHCVGDLLIDDEPDVRQEMIDRMTDIVAIVSLPADLIKLVLKAFLVRAGDFRDSTVRDSELVAHAELISKLVVKDSGKPLDTFTELEQVHQTLWDRMLPVQVRSVFARIVAKYVFSQDIYEREFMEWETGIDMILAFCDQYRPETQSDSIDDFPAFQAFIEGRDQSAVQGYLSCIPQKLASQSMGKFAEALAEHATESGFYGLSLSEELVKAALVNTGILNAVLKLVKLGTVLSNNTVKQLKEIPAGICSNTDSNYIAKYLAFRLWGFLASQELEVQTALEKFASELESQILTPGVLQTLHALESAVKRPSLESCVLDRLFDFVLHGDISSVSDIVCALDLVFVQIAKTWGEPSSSLDRLRDTLLKIRKETQNDTGSDANSLDLYCRYRLGSLDGELAQKPKKLTLDIEMAQNVPEGISASTFILANLIEAGKLAENITSLIE